MGNTTVSRRVTARYLRPWLTVMVP